MSGFDSYVTRVFHGDTIRCGFNNGSEFFIRNGEDFGRKKFFLIL